MIARTSLAWLALVVLTALPAAADELAAARVYDGHRLICVEVRSEADLEVLQALSPDIWSDYPGIGMLEARILPEQLDALRDSGLVYKIVCDDLGAALAAALPRPEGRSDWDHYMNLAEMNTWMDNLAAARPDLCEVITLGMSLEGRPMRSLHITGSGAEPKPAVFYHANQHCREWISGPVVLYLASYLISNYDTDPCVAQLVDGLHFYLAPCVNPDGYSYTWTNYRLWRKNRRNNGDGSYGVDLNRNWATGWGGGGSSGTPSSDTYRGPAPFSEPETQVLSNFIANHPNIRAYMDYHSYSQLILWPYGYANILPPEPDRTTFDTLGAGMQSRIQAVHGVFYEQGPIYSTIYQASGGSVDWVYGDQGRFGITIELRPTSAYPGFELPPEQILPTCQENLPAILYLTEFAASDLVFRFPAGVPQRIVAGESTTVSVEILPQFDNVVAGSPRLHYRYDAALPFAEVALTPLGGNAYEATLPPATCSATPEFYFTALTAGGRQIASPACAPHDVYDAIVIGASAVFYDEPLDINPGWSVQGLWAFGHPTGGGGQYGSPDPTSGHTGTNVYGYNLSGDYENSLSERHLTTQAIDCTGKQGVTLSFWRWLGVEQPSYDHAYVRVSTNGTTWTTIWENTSEIADTAWVYQEFDIAALADNQPTVYLRWTMGTTDGGWRYCGWNIDDVQLFSYDCVDPQPCYGDANCDGVVNWRDIDYFVAAMNDNQTAWQAMFAPGAPTCPFASNDVNGDGTVNWRDIDPLVAVMNTVCP